MGKIIEQKITRFDKGMTNDPRTEDFSYAQLIKNFDAHTYPHKLVPFRSSESGDGSASTNKIRNFCIALNSDPNPDAYTLYGLGVKSGVTNAQVFYKNISIGGSNDLGDATWATPSAANHQSGNTFGWFELFVYYKKTGLIYGARGTSATAGTYIWAFTPGDTTAWDDSAYAVPSGFTHLAQGLVHSKDDILYIPADNRIIKNNNGSWSVALTLPSHLYITSICEYGNFLAIATAPVSGVGNSRVYIWDRDSTLTTLSESVDFGEGTLQIIEEVEGNLIGISKTNNAGTSTFPTKIIFRQYSGGTATVFKQFVSSSNAPDLPIAKQKVNNYLYFMLSTNINGTVEGGVWKIGRNTPNDPFAITLDRTFNNDASPSAITLNDFFIINEYVFIAYNTSGTYAMTKTLSTNTYSATSYYDSLIFNAGDSSVTKKLLGATLITEPLSGTAVLKYKKDSDISGTTFTTILTNTTSNSISKSATKDASGNNLPEFKEIIFEITSTGGAVITGIKFKIEIVDKDSY